MAYTITCPRCNGTGHFCGGVCFQCKGAKRVQSATPEKAKYQASAVFSDGVRRQLANKQTETAARKEAERKIMMAPDMWDAATLEIKQR